MPTRDLLEGLVSLQLNRQLLFASWIVLMIQLPGASSPGLNLQETL